MSKILHNKQDNQQIVYVKNDPYLWQHENDITLEIQRVEDTGKTRQEHGELCSVLEKIQEKQETRPYSISSVLLHSFFYHLLKQHIL